MTSGIINRSASESYKFMIAAVALILTGLAGCNKADTETVTITAADGTTTTQAKNIELLNVSYDVARDFYKAYNPMFVEHYKDEHPEVHVTVEQSHGGSSKQALSVANGLPADVVTMNQPTDIAMLVEKGLVDANWQQALPNDSVPYSSVLVFLVRTGNPKGIHDWQDLSRDEVDVLMPNPKTSGTGRYAFLGAYGYGLLTFDKDRQRVNEYMQKLLANVATYDNGSRAATTTFTQRGIGDILITTENEAHQVANVFAKGQVDIIYPSYSIRIDNPVAEVTATTTKKGTHVAAHDYLLGLWEPAAQELIASLYLRPTDPKILAAHANTLPNIRTFEPTEVFGSWNDIMTTYFADGGLFDTLSISKN